MPVEVRVGASKGFVCSLNHHEHLVSRNCESVDYFLHTSEVADANIPERESRIPENNAMVLHHYVAHGYTSTL